MPAEAPRFFAPQAWVGGAWASDVLLSCGPDGHWLGIETGAAAPPDATRLAGPVLPGLVNGHSHAFQRAIAGMTERAAAGQDDFWSWRERMYSAALRITPQELEAIAAFLYAELLASGTTHVCEFHYLHNDLDGRPYADPGEMSLALVRAARRAGIGLTLLPVLYMHAGFGAQALRHDQRRFASTPQSVLRLGEDVERQSGGGLVRSGVALHSLRAVDADALQEVARHVRGRMPVHIHIAEQQQEVADCVAHTGHRPIDWLARNVALDAHWNLVHATQSTPAELRAVAGAGSAIVLCPTTEANLGDGTFDLPGWFALGGAWSIGSDSHASRSWSEELRLLEYSQRLALRQRNIAARHAQPLDPAARAGPSTAAVLLEGALQGGTAAAGLPLGGIAAGQRADFMVLDLEAPALLGIPEAQRLDAAVFSSPSAAPVQVFVGGVLAQPETIPLARAFTQAMNALWR